MQIGSDKKWQTRLAAQRRRRDLRERAVAYKGGGCSICGYKKCLAALDFHHIDDLTKEFTISARMTSWDRIQKELDKCALLCANCHREVHDGLHPGYLELDGPGRGQIDTIEIVFDDDEEECEF